MGILPMTRTEGPWRREGPPPCKYKIDTANAY